MQLDSPAGTTAARLVLGLVLGAWLAAATLAGAAGWFVAPPGQPPLAFLVAVVTPIVLFAAAYGTSESFRAYVRAGDPRLLTSLQSWRVVGGIFLVLLSFGLLPAAFALTAGWGDVAVAVTAPFVAAVIAGGGATRAPRWVVGWQALGILDLVAAVGTGTSLRFVAGADAEQMTALSRLLMSVIPTFAVPLFVILHLAAIAQLRAALVGGRAEEPPRAILGEVG
jgi:hypothetical protein